MLLLFYAPNFLKYFPDLYSYGYNFFVSHPFCLGVWGKNYTNSKYSLHLISTPCSSFVSHKFSLILCSTVWGWSLVCGDSGIVIYDAHVVFVAESFLVFEEGARYRSLMTSLSLCVWILDLQIHHNRMNFVICNYANEFKKKMFIAEEGFYLCDNLMCLC